MRLSLLATLLLCIAAPQSEVDAQLFSRCCKNQCCQPVSRCYQPRTCCPKPVACSQPVSSCHQQSCCSSAPAPVYSTPQSCGCNANAAQTWVNMPVNTFGYGCSANPNGSYPVMDGTLDIEPMNNAGRDARCKECCRDIGGDCVQQCLQGTGPCGCNSGINPGG